jgi:hypothetical protein
MTRNMADRKLPIRSIWRGPLADWMVAVNSEVERATHALGGDHAAIARRILGAFESLSLP